MPSISIVIPCYNAGKYLSATIESVRVQTFADWELILVDDGSKDDTVTLAQEYCRVDSRIRLTQQTNGGVARARNRGLAEADPNSDAIIFLDHDDLWEPNILEILTEALKAHPQRAAAYGVARYLDQNGEPIREGELEAEHRGRLKLVKKKLVLLHPDEATTFASLNINIGCRIVTPGQVLIRRASLNKIDPFDPAAVPGDDWDLWLRLSRHGGMIFVDHLVLGWRQHENNESRQEERMMKSHLYTRHKIISLPGLTTDERHIARYGYRLFYSLKLNAGLENLKRGRVGVAALEFARAVRGYARYASVVLLPPSFPSS